MTRSGRAEEVLAPYVTATGVEVPLVGYVVAATAS
jgi:hypothetical protein